MSDARIPRSYQATAAALSHTFSVMLQSHPEAFDCLIFPAQPSEQNEIIAVDSPTVTLLDRDERAQRYGAPIKARAMLVPDGEWAFGAVDSGLYESFHSDEEAMLLLLSVPGLRTFSLVQWLEYLDMASQETVERTVYIAENIPVGRTLGAGMVHKCYPLPASGEIPSLEDSPGAEDSNADSQAQQIGVL